MSLFSKFIDEFKQTNKQVKKSFDDSLLGKLKKLDEELKDETFLASNELKNAIQKLLYRAKEPMKIAITGQFSSGKSTFLNALLSQNILPTGITPVTSKVNYIKYADELKLKVRYLDGRDEFHRVEDISRFTDQRQEVEEISHLTLYAPLDILKDITFVDTPGLNSNSELDTQTTEEVLKQVDGIIWLSLIDNAGKMSELQVLEQYISSYANKSLCVLNQKDKFSQKEVQKSIEYINASFGKFFSSVVAISAYEALQAKCSSSEHKLNTRVNTFLNEFKKEVKSPTSLSTTQNLEKLVKDFKKDTLSIYNTDKKENLALLESSNINQVFSFIKEQIQPQATQAKRYAILAKSNFILNELINQQENILSIYESLEDILEEFEQNTQETFEILKSRFGLEIKNAFIKIEDIIEKIATEIFSQITTIEKIRYEKNQVGIIKKYDVFKAVSYNVSTINADAIYKKLFYDDDIIGKMFKKYVRELKDIQNSVNEENLLIYKNLEKKVLKWQYPHELIEKNNPLHSELEFANVRKFASKAYENFLKSFHNKISSSYAIISSEFNHLSSAVSFNYQNATEVCVSFLTNKINESIKLHEEDSTKFPLYCPNIEDIKQRLKISFHMYELENLMNSNQTFLDKNYNHMIDSFYHINIEKKEFLAQKKLSCQKKINHLKSLKNNL